MPADAPDILARLDLEQIELTIFRGWCQSGAPARAFGGQVAAQALAAAGRTVPADRWVHSLHAYFLRPGNPGAPIVYEVDRIRDGRSFTTRRVVAVQHGEAIFHLSASFHVHEDGPEHQATMPAVPDPETLPVAREQPIDLRIVPDEPVSDDADPVARSRQLVWMRVPDRLPDDPLVHACVATYASDLMLFGTALKVHRIDEATQMLMGTSLDHAMWFHRPLRADDWLLYAQDSPSMSGARGLTRGQVFTRDGRLAVSIVQEGLMRLRPDWREHVV